jgi:hypothetical protein
MFRCFLALLATACAVSVAETASPVASSPVDSDGDGLSDLDELALGSDPTLADTDHDRLDDGVEGAMGTDPTRFDTDGDGFFDGDEASAYRDPLDPTSVIYEGGWPYTSDMGAYLPGGDGC